MLLPPRRKYTNSRDGSAVAVEIVEKVTMELLAKGFILSENYSQ